MKKLVLKVLAEFGINEVESITRIEDKDMWNIDDKYFIKTYTDLSWLDRILLMYNELRQAEVPLAVYNKTSAGELYVKIGDVYYTLMDKVIGSHIDYQKEANPFLFGKNLARLHRGLKNLTKKIDCSNISADLIQQLNGWIIKAILENNLEIKKEIIDYCIGFDKVYRSLPKQLIHRDLHGGNMLFNNGELSAFIDFDISEANARLFDICYCMDLGNGKTDEEAIKWLGTLKKFLSGYNSISEIKDEELEALPYMFISIQLLTVAFFSSSPNKPKYVVYEEDKNIEYLNWLYDNKDSFLFSRQDILNLMMDI